MTKVSPLVRDVRGLLDTSVVIDLDVIGPEQLAEEVVISSITLAELSAGPHATDEPAARARRQDRLQRVETQLDPLPFDGAAARAYGRVYAATRDAGRQARGPRALDLMIAAVALANDLPLYTRNPADVEHLGVIGLDVRPV